MTWDASIDGSPAVALQRPQWHREDVTDRQLVGVASDLLAEGFRLALVAAHEDADAFRIAMAGVEAIGRGRDRIPRSQSRVDRRPPPAPTPHDESAELELAEGTFIAVHVDGKPGDATELLRAVLRWKRGSFAFKPDADKPPILRAYLKKWAFEVGVFFEGVTADAPESTLQAVSPRYPIFRITAPQH